MRFILKVNDWDALAEKLDQLKKTSNIEHNPKANAQNCKKNTYLRKRLETSLLANTL